jgi:hypothetical protein
MVVVNRIKPFCGCIAGRDYYPGANVLTDAEYAAVKSHRTFQEEIKFGIIEVTENVPAKVPVVVPPETTVPDSVALSIQAAPTGVAVKTIKNILDRRTLEAICKSDSRSKVVDACEAQIAMLLSREE